MERRRVRRRPRAPGHRRSERRTRPALRRRSAVGVLPVRGRARAPRGTSSWSSGSARRWPRRPAPRAHRCCSDPRSTSSARRSAVATSSASRRIRTSPRGSPAPTCGACRAAGWRRASSTWWRTTRSTTASRSPPSSTSARCGRCRSCRSSTSCAAGAWSTMAAYNRLHGTHCSANERLLTTILRDEWGWDGVVISDWFAVHSTVEPANAGLDLEMPGPRAALGSEAGGRHRRRRGQRGRDRGQARAVGAPGPPDRRRGGSARGGGGGRRHRRRSSIAREAAAAVARAPAQRGRAPARRLDRERGAGRTQRAIAR